MRLRNFEFHPRTELRVLRRDSAEERLKAASMRCRLVSPSARTAFGLVAASILNELLNDPSLDLGARVLGLQDLFAQLIDAPATTDVLGLWGELFLIAHAADPVRMARAWRDNPHRVFDFLEANDRIEVKTTRDLARKHWFSMDQLRGSSDARVTVASLVVTELEEGGVSASALLRQVCETLARDDLDVANHVMRKAVATVGSHLDEATEAYDLRQARRSLRLIPFGELPRISVPAEVVDARWRCSLADLIEVTRDEASEGSLLGLVVRPPR